MGDAKPVSRGRDAVQGALVQAARELLAEVGPSVGLREIAERAGVNKGQIHHYFGGKAGLIQEAFRSVSREHFDKWQELSKGDSPVELTLGADDWYWQVLVRLVLDGDLETASLGLQEQTSVPRAKLSKLMDELGLDEVEPALKARFAAAMAMELGWAAFSPFIQLVLEADKAEMEEILPLLRAHVSQMTDGH